MVLALRLGWLSITRHLTRRLAVLAVRSGLLPLVVTMRTYSQCQPILRRMWQLLEASRYGAMMVQMNRVGTQAATSGSSSSAGK